MTYARSPSRPSASPKAGSHCSSRSACARRKKPDRPRYGYAKASHTDRRAFRLLITHVLDRTRLAGVLWLLDIRREPSDDDRAMQELFAERETPVLAALTKGDTLARAARARREGELRSALELEADQMIVTSAREKEGIEELREAIGGLVRAESPG